MFGIWLINVVDNAIKQQRIILCDNKQNCIELIAVTVLTLSVVKDYRDEGKNEYMEFDDVAAANVYWNLPGPHYYH